MIDLLVSTGLKYGLFVPVKCVRFGGVGELTSVRRSVEWFPVVVVRTELLAVGRCVSRVSVVQYARSVTDIDVDSDFGIDADADRFDSVLVADSAPCSIDAVVCAVWSERVDVKSVFRVVDVGSDASVIPGDAGTDGDGRRCDDGDHIDVDKIIAIPTMIPMTATQRNGGDCSLSINRRAPPPAITNRAPRRPSTVISSSYNRFR